MAAAKLERELRQRRPILLREEEVVLNIWRTSDQLQIRFDRLFREYGLTSSQYNILRILRGSDNPLPILEIAERTITVVPGITGLIDRLEQAALVNRIRCTHDRRVIYVKLCTKGERTLASLDGPIHALHKKLMSHLNRADLEKLIALLEKVREPLAQQSE